MVYFKRLRSSGFVSLEAFKMYYVMRTFAPSLHRKSTDFLIQLTRRVQRISHNSHKRDANATKYSNVFSKEDLGQIHLVKYKFMIIRIPCIAL